MYGINVMLKEVLSTFLLTYHYNIIFLFTLITVHSGDFWNEEKNCYNNNIKSILMGFLVFLCA